MTTTTTQKNVETPLTPSLFNIQYPNCRTGMFSLREPFKDMKTENLPTESEPLSTRILTPAVIQPTYLNADRESAKKAQPTPVSRPISKRNAEVQCSLLVPDTRRDIAVQTKADRQRIAANPSNDDNDLNPRYRVRRKLQPVEQQPKIYEIWEEESPSLRAIPINRTTRRRGPRARHVRNKKPVIIDYDDDDDDDEEEEESDYDDERIVYPRQPRKTIKKTYLPPNVRMICVRDDTNRGSY